MDRLDLKFLMLGAAMLVLGVAMGIYMGIVHDFQLSPVHAHVNLVGWVSLSLFGIVYRLFPELQGRKLARLHFLLAAPAGIVFPFGIALAVLADKPLLAIIASLLWFVGATLFLVQLTGLAFSRSASAAMLVAAE
jgi:cbb3-type cytochrome oxidase subunit 1